MSDHVITPEITPEQQDACLASIMSASEEQEFLTIPEEINNEKDFYNWIQEV